MLEDHACVAETAAVPVLRGFLAAAGTEREHSQDGVRRQQATWPRARALPPCCPCSGRCRSLRSYLFVMPVRSITRRKAPNRRRLHAYGPFSAPKRLSVSRLQLQSLWAIKKTEMRAYGAVS